MRDRPMILRSSRSTFLALAAAMGASILTSCVGGEMPRAYRTISAGVPGRGKQVIMEKRCGACHTIPGIPNAHGLVGPPLFFFSRRTYIAGEVPNTPANLVKWVMSPQSIEPKTAMPTLGLSEQQARDVAAYLYGLQ